MFLPASTNNHNNNNNNHNPTLPPKSTPQLLDLTPVLAPTLDHALSHHHANMPIHGRSTADIAANVNGTAKQIVIAPGTVIARTTTIAVREGRRAMRRRERGRSDTVTVIASVIEIENGKVEMTRAVGIEVDVRKRRTKRRRTKKRRRRRRWEKRRRKTDEAIVHLTAQHVVRQRRKTLIPPLLLQSPLLLRKTLKPSPHLLGFLKRMQAGQETIRLRRAAVAATKSANVSGKRIDTTVTEIGNVNVNGGETRIKIGNAAVTALILVIRRPNLIIALRIAVGLMVRMMPPPQQLLLPVPLPQLQLRRQSNITNAPSKRMNIPLNAKPGTASVYSKSNKDEKP